VIFVRTYINVSVLVPTEARCTFESGFCGWRNTSGEMSLTWKLYKGDRHKFTGPKWDNTFRNRTGNVTTRFGRQTKININNIFSPLFFITLGVRDMRSGFFFPQNIFRFSVLFRRYLRLRGHVRIILSRGDGSHGQYTFPPTTHLLFRHAVEILQFLLCEYPLHSDRCCSRKLFSVCRFITGSRNNLNSR